MKDILGNELKVGDQIVAAEERCGEPFLSFHIIRKMPKEYDNLIFVENIFNGFRGTFRAKEIALLKRKQLLKK